MISLLMEREREQNWDRVKIKDIFDTKNGYTPSKSNPEFWNNGTEPWFRLDDIRENGHVLYDSLQKVSKSAIKKTLFSADSIALTTSATVGEHALIRIPSIGNQRFVYFTPKKIYSNSINMLYMNYYFFIIDEWCKIHINMGSSFPTVDMKSLYEMEIPLPPIEQQTMIANLLTMYDDVIDTVKKEKEDYEKIKTQMMNMIFA